MTKDSPFPSPLPQISLFHPVVNQNYLPTYYYSGRIPQIFAPRIILSLPTPFVFETNSQHTYVHTYVQGEFFLLHRSDQVFLRKKPRSCPVRYYHPNPSLISSHFIHLISSPFFIFFALLRYPTYLPTYLLPTSVDVRAFLFAHYRTMFFLQPIQS